MTETHTEAPSSYAPSTQFVAQANAGDDLYRKAEQDRLTFWAEQANRLSWATPFSQVLDWSAAPFAKWFTDGKLNVTYVRNGQEKQATVVVADRAKLFAERADQSDDTPEESEPAPTKLGITVKPVTPETAERMGTPEGKGVQVSDVKADSFGYDLGLQPGMVIMKVNKQPVNSEEDFHKITSQLKSGQDVVFLVRAGRGAGGGNAFISGTIP